MLQVALKVKVHAQAGEKAENDGLTRTFHRGSHCSRQGSLDHFMKTSFIFFVGCCWLAARVPTPTLH
jgi:hypothetical protein